MSEIESMDFESLELIEVPVKIGDVKYVLHEADEGAAKAYQNARMRGAKLDDGKVSWQLTEDLAGIPSMMLSLCLFRLTEEGKPFSSPVSLREITGYREGNGIVHKGWPARIVKPVFKRLKDISELDDDETLESLQEQQEELGNRIAKIKEETAKNEQGATTTGSE